VTEHETILMTVRLPFVLYERWRGLFPRGSLSAELTDALEVAVSLAEPLPPRPLEELVSSAEHAVRSWRKILAQEEERLAALRTAVTARGGPS
jgi:hypothetical protein